jgi:hypothetical protein
LKRSFLWPSLKRRCYWVFKRKKTPSGNPLDGITDSHENEL